MRYKAPFPGYLAGRHYVSVGSAALLHIASSEPYGGTLCDVYTAGKPLADRSPENGKEYQLCPRCRNSALASLTEAHPTEL